MAESASLFKPGATLIAVLSVLIVGGAIGVIVMSLRVVEGVEDTRTKVKLYDVKAKNPFDTSPVPSFFGYKSEEKQLRKTFPESSAFIERGKLDIAAGRYNQAVADYEQALKAYVVSAPMKKTRSGEVLLSACYRGIAVGYFGLQKYEQALVAINKSMDNGATQHEFDLRSKIYEKLGRSDLAKADKQSAEAVQREQFKILEDL